MNKPPAFQMYPGDFLSDIKVILMSMDERGVYITLLCHHWIENGLPNNENELQRLCHHPENWPQIWKKVGQCFYEKNGKLFNKRLQKEKKKQKEWRNKSRLGGIKSGETRRKMAEAKENHPSGKVEPKTNTSSSSSSSSSSSPSMKKVKTNKRLFLVQEFEKLWKAYHPDGKKNKSYSLKRFAALFDKGELENFKKGMSGYATYLEFKRKKENFDQRVQYFSTFCTNYKEYIKYYGHKVEPDL